MTRETVVALVLVALAMVALWCSTLTVAAFRAHATESESSAWRLLTRPLLAPALVFGGVIGWAVTDPDDCEMAGITVRVVAAAAALVVLRAAARAI